MLFNAVRVLTFAGTAPLTSGSGFWFRRDEHLFLVTSRHVFFDAASGHRPDRVEFDVHVDPHDLARSAVVEVSLFVHGHAAWMQGQDSGGDATLLRRWLSWDSRSASTTHCTDCPSCGRLLSPLLSA
ncbi:hypothetical protein ACPWT1_20295 [Ramlibacter sp. MMS24-I3-19]|uniref:hypothetical protein n=1 Tax=Ramlibacter sp. MMS24-I3-19 TaxID=3416606 RepID=UPI003CFCFF13